ncbi:hypothetical protein HK405_013876 [Cladochytrium tenue]|nr:hypothetical protein HK405_013876 [Cladochytrium tenue]
MTDLGCIKEDASASIITSNSQESLTRDGLPTVDCCNSTPYIMLQQDCSASDGSCTFTCVCITQSWFNTISGSVQPQGSTNCGNDMTCSGLHTMNCGHISSISWEIYRHDVDTSSSSVAAAVTAVTTSDSSSGTTSGGDGSGDTASESSGTAGTASASDVTSASSGQAGITIAAPTGSSGSNGSSGSSASNSAAVSNTSGSGSSAGGGDSSSQSPPLAAIVGGVVGGLVVLAAIVLALIAWSRRRRADAAYDSKPSPVMTSYTSASDPAMTAVLPRRVSAAAAANGWGAPSGGNTASDTASLAAAAVPMGMAPAAAYASARGPSPPMPAAVSRSLAPPAVAAAMLSPAPSSSMFSPSLSSPHAPFAFSVASTSPDLPSSAASLRPSLDGNHHYHTPSPPRDEANPFLSPAANPFAAAPALEVAPPTLSAAAAAALALAQGPPPTGAVDLSRMPSALVNREVRQAEYTEDENPFGM